ncbi:hypothetical protein R3P38DRAFT_2825823 [Favolaschia claudopus]|uniref:Uncharacterized protein n=1 Tax=Favolaschia claudopus TaxID=2862362 RepID=A0AAW0EJ20_9AGAR
MFLMSSLPVAISIFYAWSCIQLVSALTGDVKIDDTDTTHWNFVGSYHAVTPTSPCIDCFANPDPGLVYNSTWHDGALRSGSFKFQGSAVYIYGVDVINPANVTFAMDNPSLTGSHYYSGQGYVYNSLFFSASNLDPSVEHTVAWQMELGSKGGGSALFDYAVITIELPTESSSSAPTSSESTSSTSSPSFTTADATSSASPSTDVLSPSKKSNAGAIAGAIVGVLAVVAILGGTYIFLRRRRLTYDHDKTLKEEPFTDYVVEPFSPPDLLPPSPPPPTFHGGSSDSTSTSMAQGPSTSVSAPSSDRKGGLRESPLVLSWNPRSNDATTSPAVDSVVEERLRHLEEVVAASQESQPPRYSVHTR